MSEHKVSYLRSVLSLRCPGCRKVSMFKNPSTYSLQNLGEVNQVCPKCGTKLVPETGFYFGAAYANWALTVALWVSILVALKVFDALGLIEFGFLTHPMTFLISGILLTLVLFPYMFRLSRSMWAHFFIQKKESEQL